MPNLAIPERLFVLTIDERGTIPAPVRRVLHYGLAGAVLAELALARKIGLQDGRLARVDATPTGDAWIDGAMAAIAAGQKPRRLTRWIAALGHPGIVEEIGERLAKRDVIRAEGKRYLWGMPPEGGSQVEAPGGCSGRRQLRDIVLADEKAEARDITLLSLLKACRLSRLLFAREEREYADRQLAALVHGEVFGEAVAGLLAEVDTAAATVGAGCLDSPHRARYTTGTSVP